uniref:Uncharacterized protein n=1 Tax=Oryza sativa subsp. japonica TaxID=39947 RepID=Q6YVF7_ORYSJ|nr:hypothetical protein [Oryza sativa Japonica Group]
MDGRMASIIDGVAAGVAVSEEEIWRIRSLASRPRVAFRPPPPIHQSPPQPGGILCCCCWQTSGGGCGVYVRTHHWSQTKATCTRLH